MKTTTSLLATAFSLLPLTLGDWKYKSRPDLAPPRLNITIPASSHVDQGYLFVSPFAGLQDTATEQHGPRQAGPYIFRDDGDLVWSGYGLYSIWATNFQAGMWKGDDVLFSFEGDHNAHYGHGHGHITFMDRRYETIRELRAGNHKLMDKHEFRIIDETTGLIQVYQPVPRSLTAWGAEPEQQWIVNAIFQELDIATGKLLFEWSSLDHIDPSESVLPITKGQAGAGYNSSDAWDYYHINSVDKDREGKYLISARDACSIHKMNGTSGEIIWRLNGKRSDFQMGENSTFCFQHHARWLKQEDDIEIISLYDNSAHGTESSDGDELATAPTSSGKILKLNTTSWTADLVQGFYPPGNALRSKSQGSMQVLPNGNALVNWGSEGAMTEFLPNGTAIFHAYMDSGALGVGVQNYRAFRYEWVGTPSEVPAIVALEMRDGSGTGVFVSWNGDTETRGWRFFEEGGEGGERKLLAELQRTSFETAFFVTGRVVRFVSAEAVGADGRVLTTTGIARLEPEILPASSGERVGHQHEYVEPDSLGEQDILGQPST